MRHHKIPDEAVKRLPVYLRGLMLLAGQLRQNISSQQLADYLGIMPCQIRKDFSYFGAFGKPGVGYSVNELITQIKKILKIDMGHKVALIGAGNLGKALLAYPGFKIYGFDIIAVYDNNIKKIGKKFENIIIEDVSSLDSIKKRKIDLAIIAVPRQAAQQIVNAVIKTGIKGILNFSPCQINVPDDVKLITIDIATDLARLPYYAL